jgi:hypothetical protein
MTTVTHYCLGKPIFGGKPTLHIKRLKFTGHSPNNIKLKTASSIPCPEQLKKEREKAVKAMSLNIGF